MKTKIQKSESSTIYINLSMHMKTYFTFIIFITHSLFVTAQNIGISTDGSTPETGVMLDVKGTNTAATTATQNIFQLKSFDASASALKLRLILGTNATASSRYAGLEVYDAGASAYRSLSLQPNGGNVGIGTIAPICKVHVVGQSATDRGIVHTLYNNNGGLPPYIVTEFSRGTFASPLAVQSGDYLGLFGCQGFNGTLFAPQNYPAGMFSQATENFTGTANGSNLEFFTVANGTTNGLERMRIDQNGNVGIGTTTPASLLTVVDQNNAGLRFEQYNNVDGVNIRTFAASGTIASPTQITTNKQLAALTVFGYTNSSAFSSAVAQISFLASEPFTSTANGGCIRFLTTQKLSTTPFERMRIDDAGNVGIGTSAPSATAILDASAVNNKGILLPQVSLVSTTDVTTIASPATSLLVYNTNASMTNGNGAGYYYWDGAKWTPMISGSSSVSGVTFPPTQISNQTWSVVNWQTCVQNCANYTGTTAGDGGFTDWRTPDTPEYQYALQVFTSPTGGWQNNQFWTRTPYWGGSDSRYFEILNESTYSSVSTVNTSTYNCRCVR